jgi:hypothetical protein
LCASVETKPKQIGGTEVNVNLQRRLEKLEAVARETEDTNRVEVQLGCCQELPKDYVGERHIVEVSRLPNGDHEWEERPGPAPNGDEGRSRHLVRVVFVNAKDGREVPYRLGDALREMGAEAPGEGMVN